MANQQSFLQSKEWQRFQEILGRQTFWVGDVLLIEMPLRFNKTYLYSPRCSEAVFGNDFLKQLKTIKKKNHIFLRVEPLLSNRPGDQNLIGAYKKISSNLQPSQTLILDLAKDEEQLLTEMHHKTRYNIRLAQRHGVKIKMGQKYFDEFWKLMQETAARDRIKIFPKNYYQNQLITTDSFRNEIFVAEYEKELVAGNIVNFYGETVTYLHGASSAKHRNIMAPNLLQWEQIREAKRRNFLYYDFWGFDEKKWPGVSRFKKGFGGQVVKYLGACDLVWDKEWYWLYGLSKRFFKLMPNR